MDRGFDRVLRRPETGGHYGVAPGRRLSQQALFELVELGRAWLTGRLRAKGGEQAVDDRQCPAPLEERFGSGVIDRLDDVQAFGVLERDLLPATAPPLRSCTCRQFET